jgi:hypothetical protein
MEPEIVRADGSACGTDVTLRVLAGVSTLVFAAAMLGVSVASAGQGAVASTPVSEPPLIGAAYSHWATPACSPTGTGIVATYDQPGVRQRVRLQLAAMRAAGIESLRLLLWHMSDVSGQDWGVVPSAGGHLVEPYRSNLINYLEDVRAADFKALTLDFGPEWTNDPIGFPQNLYDPAKFDENWGFIRDVRPLVKEHGPPVTRIDLLSEGAPSSYLPATVPQLEGYISEMYGRYVDAFGKSDVTVSAIAPPEPNADITQPEGGHRLQNLIDAFAASGRGQPDFFSVHVSNWWHPSAENTLYGLREEDATLTANGLSQPLVVSETTYNDPALAAAIQQFRQTSPRPILEVQEWPLRPGSPCKDFSVSPPLQANAYISALTGAPPSSRLTASITTTNVILLTPYRDRVTALSAGTYQLVVSDTSAKEGFQLLGPRTHKKTGTRFRGTVRWTINLHPGTYRYRAVGPPSQVEHRFVVLTPG